MAEKYTEKQWEEEMRLGQFCGRHAAFGSCNLECHSCHEVGFYGPREIRSEGRKYRACKWCGFWQEAVGPVFDYRGGASYPCSIRVHKSCGEEGSWGTAGEGLWCEKCKDNVIELGAHKDDPNFQKIKEDMDKIHQSINFPRVPTQ